MNKKADIQGMLNMVVGRIFRIESFFTIHQWHDIITQTYRLSQGFKVQATNDFIIIGIQAVSPLSVGVLLFPLRWSTLIIASMPIIIIMLSASYWYFLYSKMQLRGD